MKKQILFILFIVVLGLGAECHAQEDAKYYLFNSDCNVWTAYEQNVSKARGYSSKDAALIKEAYLSGLINAYSLENVGDPEVDDPWYTFPASVETYVNEIDKYCSEYLQEPPKEKDFQIAEILLIVNYAMKLAE